MAEVYKFESILIQNSDIVGFKLINPDNISNTNYRINSILELGKRGLIEGCDIIEQDSKSCIHSTNPRLSKLPFIDLGIKNKSLFTAKTRLVRDEHTMGYIILDDTGKEYRVSKEKLWKLARYSLVTNIRATIHNNKKIIRGKGTSLMSLETISI